MKARNCKLLVLIMVIIGITLFSQSSVFAKAKTVRYSGWTFDSVENGYIKNAKIKGKKLIIKGKLVKKSGKSSKLLKNKKTTFKLTSKTKYYLVGLGEPEPSAKVSKKEFNRTLTQDGRGLPSGLHINIYVKKGKVTKVTMGV